MRMPSTIFVIDTPDFVMMCRKLGKDCIYPVYRFDNAYHAARAACEDIATIKDKLVMNAIYSEIAPLVYKPSDGKLDDMETNNDYRSRLKGIIA